MQDAKLPLEAENESSSGKQSEDSLSASASVSDTPDGGAGSPSAAPTDPAPEPAKEAERALVRLSADDHPVQAIIPRDEQEVARLATAIIRSGIVPSAFKHKENVRNDKDQIIHAKGEPNSALIAMGILKSLELGLPPLTGLSYLLPINDRFTIWGDGAVALAQSKGLIVNQARREIGPAKEPKLELAEWPDEYGVEVRYWRRGQEEPYIGRYTVADARRAKLWLNASKEPWLKYPDRMLFNRARAFALRDGFADALSGLSIAEEVRDMTPEPIDGGELKPHASKSAQVDDEEE